MSRRRLLGSLSLGVVFASGFYAGNAVLGGDGGEMPTLEERKAAFDRLAKSYDSAVGLDEDLIGVTKRRRELMSHVHGRVLEVGVGSGRNSPFVPWDSVSSYIAVDRSEPMVLAAREKLPAAGTVVVADSEMLPFADSDFDTVVSTYTLCSVSDPEVAFQEMERVCRPGGSILLLEHGRSEWVAVNWLLDRHAPGHARQFGCIWNRDLRKVITSNSHVEVEAKDIHHFGTGLLYRIRKK